MILPATFDRPESPAVAAGYNAASMVAVWDRVFISAGNVGLVPSPDYHFASVETLPLGRSFEGWIPRSLKLSMQGTYSILDPLSQDGGVLKSSWSYDIDSNFQFVDGLTPWWQVVGELRKVDFRGQSVVAPLIVKADARAWPGMTCDFFGSYGGWPDGTKVMRLKRIDWTDAGWKPVWQGTPYPGFSFSARPPMRLR